MWTMFSILFMIAGIGLLAWHYAVWHRREEHVEPPARPAGRDRWSRRRCAPPRNISGWFWRCSWCRSAGRDHRALPGGRPGGLRHSDFAIPAVLADAQLACTQLAVLWIATAWLGTGLYIARRCPGMNRNSSAWASTSCLLPAGHRGRRLRRPVVGGDAEDGPAVQLLVRPPGAGNTPTSAASGRSSCSSACCVAAADGPRTVAGVAAQGRNFLDRGLLFLSTVAIGCSTRPGLMWGENTHISTVEYWRWWVVHLGRRLLRGVRGGGDGFLFVKLGLVRAAPRPSTCCSPPSCSGRRHPRHVPPTCTSPAPPPA